MMATKSTGFLAKIKNNIKSSAKESLGLYELRQQRTLFDEECL
jgi:hypothetical protein